MKFFRNELVNHIQAKGIQIICIEYSNVKSTIHLKGNLESFFAAINALNKTAVFMQEFSFDEDDFFHEPDTKVLGEYGQFIEGKSKYQNSGINLIQFLPQLEEYKSYIGQTSCLLFRIFFENQSLSYFHNAEWYDAFNNSFKEAKEIFETKEYETKTKRELEEVTLREKTEKRENELLQLLETLPDDDKFVSLSTQKAKTEYVLARYPELINLSPIRLKDEISNLNARIQARKLLN